LFVIFLIMSIEAAGTCVAAKLVGREEGVVSTEIRGSALELEGGLKERGATRRVWDCTGLRCGWKWGWEEGVWRGCAVTGGEENCGRAAWGVAANLGFILPLTSAAAIGLAFKFSIEFPPRTGIVKFSEGTRENPPCPMLIFGLRLCTGGLRFTFALVLK
jgi:hypothetical protein